MKIIRAYKHKHNANKSKVNKVKNILYEYRKTANKIAKHQWLLFIRGGKFNKNENIKHIDNQLSERYKQTCQYQVVSILNSYLSNRQNDFVNIVMNSELDNETKHILLFINKKKAWFNEKYKNITIRNEDGKIIRKIEINKEHYKLARKILKYTFKRNRFPRFNKISMHLDQKVAIIEKKKPNLAKEFDYWIKLSTLEKGNPIYIPIYGNTYFESINGNMLNFLQINETYDDLEFVFLKELPKDNTYIPKIDKISIDLGLNILFATDKGDLFGRNFFNKLLYYDNLITTLQKNLQREGLKPSQSKRFRRLVRKCKNFIKNEINRLINRIITIYQPKEIVIENLDFRGSKLSKQLNRILHKIGIGIIKRKLRDLEERLGIKITYVNPAYTSQTCSNCGYVDKRNRKSQSEFECKYCGKKIHADVNASRNIGTRSSSPMIYHKRRSVLKMLVRAFLSDAKCLRPNSRAGEVILSNPYFRDYLESLPKGQHGNSMNFHVIPDYVITILPKFH